MSFRREVYNACVSIYSKCQKYESSPIFVKKLEIKLYPEFLSTRTCTCGPQICSLSARTCTLWSTIAFDIFALTFLPNLLANFLAFIGNLTLVNLVWYKHEHKG